MDEKIRAIGRVDYDEIKTGKKGDGYYTILAGVTAGEIVVKSGNSLIDFEALMQGVL